MTALHSPTIRVCRRDCCTARDIWTGSASVDVAQHAALPFNFAGYAIKRGDCMYQTLACTAGSKQDRWTLFDSANRGKAALLFPKLEWK
jgi:hypothetical protein